jgi:NADH:ubiquinone oxidoreductase subunit 2 (subunit N)
MRSRAPFAAFAMAVFMLALTGIPPTALFWGKVFLFAAAIQTGYLWLAVFGIANSVVSLYYYVGVIRAMWQMAPSQAGVPEGEASPRAVDTPLLRGLLAVTTAGALLPGFFPDTLVRLAQAASLLLRL